MTATVDTPGYLSLAPLCGGPLPLDGARTLPEVFARTVARFADDVALRTLGETRVLTWNQYRGRVADVAGGLTGLGVRRGDSVGLMLANRPEFFVVDTAAQHLGATPFSVYNTSSAEQVAYLFSDAANRVVVTERQFLPIVRAALAIGGSVDHIVVIDGAGEDGTLTLDGLVAAAPAGFDLAEASAVVQPADVATLIYTSGTTGPPKGVELTHANLIAQWNMLVRTWPIKPGGRVVSYLPAAHIADRTIGIYLANNLGYTVTCCPDASRLGAALVECRPTIFLAVPRVWEKLKTAVEAQVAAAPAEFRAAFDDAVEANLARVRAEQAGTEVDAATARRASAGEEAVLAPLRAKLGLDAAEVRLVGAAPTPMPVHEFFAALGLMMAEVWGMSELSPIATWNPPGRIKLGTCGTALPGVEVRLAEDGEVLVRGPIVMRGYRNQPERTAEAVDEQGYMHTGDVGRIDADGYLTIIDRKKELIINSGGKNMSPANIEAELKSGSALIGQAVCFGDARPYNVAILVLDAEAVPAFAAEHGLDGSNLASFSEDPAVLAEVGAGVARANAKLSRIEQIKRWKLLADEWLPAGDELTPTSKLRRKPIAAKYAADIEALYAG
ncbi:MULTISPECIES: AMP-dependent synthetase/ligase [unclassified Pseudonocardia]|uniref:AMP-dependent synthetase/ligase n=1 Tax=unclassified Pseudonocardia TaxID=2619320 RepID=UPI000A3FAFA0|nr:MULTISPECIES: AMP-dependent synthetase/ligase [unclassified Pseudonocardia]